MAPAQQSAEELTAVTDEILALGESLDDRAWRAGPCGGDQRSVCQLFHHIADGLRMAVEWCNLALAGRPIPTTRADVDRLNAMEAAALPNPDRQETLLRIRELREECVSQMRGLTPDQLGVTTWHEGAQRSMTVEDLNALAVRHMTMHLAAIREGLAAAAGSG